MNTTIQIRIDRATKTKAQKAFRNMGLDLSSGVKYLLARELNPENITYVCDYGYLHKYSHSSSDDIHASPCNDKSYWI